MSKYHAPALDKGLDIIEYLSLKAVPLSQVEIAHGLEKTANEIYRMLICLENRGYVIKDRVSGKYSLSLKLYHLSHRHSPVDELLRTAKPIMDQLSGSTKQSCHLSVLHDYQLMVVSQSKSPGPISLSIEEGSLYPLVLTTSGRVLLAGMSRKQQESTLNQTQEYKGFTAQEQQQFLQRLLQIQNRGFDLDQSEITSGVTDVAVPIGQMPSGVYAVLAISSLTRLSTENPSTDFLLNQLQQAAREINRSIGLSEALPTE